MAALLDRSLRTVSRLAMSMSMLFRNGYWLPVIHRAFEERSVAVIVLSVHNSWKYVNTFEEFDVI